MTVNDTRALIEEHMLAQAGSMGELLQQFRDRISPVLIDGPGWDKLLERAHGLPVSLATSGFGFELPLHQREPKADFGVALFEGSTSAARFKEWCRSQPADASTSNLIRLMSEMGREQSALGRIAGKKLLLEYDVDAPHGGAPPAPGIFLYPTDDSRPGEGFIRRLEDLAVMADAVEAAAGQKPDAAQRQQIERVFMALPPDTCIGGMGTFPDRPRGMRLAISGFRNTRDLTAFLERSGWPGKTSAVTPVVSDLEERGAFAHVGAHIDVRAGGVGPALGVGFYARDSQWLKDIQPWMPLIDGLGEHDLAVPEKLSALAKSWSGAETVFGRRGILMVVKGIHHIKAVLVDGRWKQVKAYVFLLVFPPPQAVAAAAATSSPEAR